MAYGPTITLTHAGASSTPIFISDIRMYTDGPHYAHDQGSGGGTYVPQSGTRTLPYTGDVARSYESGCIRTFIDNGEITVAWTHGTEFADSNSQQQLFTASMTNTSTDTFYWVAPHALKVLSIKVYSNVVPVNDGTYIATIQGAGNTLLVAATFDLETIAAADTAEDLSLTATTANLTLAEDDMVSVVLAATDAFTAGDLIVILEYAHR